MMRLIFILSLLFSVPASSQYISAWPVQDDELALVAYLLESICYEPQNLTPRHSFIIRGGEQFDRFTMVGRMVEDCTPKSIKGNDLPWSVAEATDADLEVVLKNLEAACIDPKLVTARTIREDSASDENEPHPPAPTFYIVGREIDGCNLTLRRK